MVPLIPLDLLKHLQEVFPNKLPEAYCPPEQLGALQGQQKVITYLLHQFKRQNPLTSGK